jgi:hypothetical protein
VTDFDIARQQAWDRFAAHASECTFIRVGPNREMLDNVKDRSAQLAAERADALLAERDKRFTAEGSALGLKPATEPLAPRFMGSAD